MDYPKSVPSVGLVNGKFVDENPATGMPGSLIPASWGNAVTDEITSVIQGADIAPAEGDTTQLKRSILKMIAASISAVWVAASETVSGVAKVAPQSVVNSGVDHQTIVTPKTLNSFVLDFWNYRNVSATETVRGVSTVATQTSVDAGVEDGAFVSPKKLKFGFSSILAPNGYLSLPSWLGGMTFQWGYALSGAGTGTSVTFPRAFQSQCFGVMCNADPLATGYAEYVHAGSFTTNGFMFYGVLWSFDVTMTNIPGWWFAYGK